RRIEELSGHLREGLLALPDVQLNGCPEQRIPHTLNLCITRSGFTSSQLSHSLALSSTSACNSASNAPSHVLLALGMDSAKALASVRVSLGRYTTQADVERAIEVFSKPSARLLRSGNLHRLPSRPANGRFLPFLPAN
ncbi:aminotransferase class V-fold PLP-dependent enzyme, partial [Pseudomonas syringae pv. actinidiae]|nr:aminotransferase class V-fold PLP-dependent enzyme [Pseudomonas syringae pv. actinidiae]